MFYIVETPEQLSKLSVYAEDDCFIQVITSHDEVHPNMSSLCLIYYRPLTAKHGFILADDHTETLGIDSNSLHDFMESLEGQIWTIDKKEILYSHFPLKSVKGLKMAYVLSNKYPDTKFYTSAHNYYNKILSNRNDVNRFIPVSKHFERFEAMFETFDFTLQPDGMDFYSDIVEPNFHQIEQTGVCVNFKEIYKQYPHFKFERSYQEGFLFSQFNLYNLTARPSCKFNGINFMGMNKSDGARKMIVPMFEYLVEFDYKSYQVKLLADLIEYPFTGNIHEELAKIYFQTDEITPSMYADAKLMTFQYSYGRVEASDIEFFKQVYALRDRLWEFAQANGYIISPISGRRLYNITKITQVLPHLMQCIETERNALIIDKLHKFLYNHVTRLILYCYDSFLFDVDSREGMVLLMQIKEILEEDDYQTSMSFGYNYGEMNRTIIS